MLIEWYLPGIIHVSHCICHIVLEFKSPQLKLHLLSTPHTMNRAARILQTRAYATVHPRRTPSFRELTRAPVFKTLFLTIVFGSVVVESTKSRKEIEALKTAYEAKFRIIEDVTRKIRNKEPVNVAQELSIANSITRNKYNSVTDVELDEQFEAFLKLVDEPDDLEQLTAQPVEASKQTVIDETPVSNVEKKDEKLFL